jgi:23S rRNA (guanosine2251-2'-O)-methyltransferase
MQKKSMESLDRPSLEAFREQQKLPIVLVLDNVRSGLNVGSIFRSADAFSIEKILLCGITAQPPHREILKTALGSTESVEWAYFEETADAIDYLKAQNAAIFAIEQAEPQIFLNDFEPPQGQILAFILGNEVDGVEETLLPRCDGVIEIPQFGTKHSLNVAVAAGIVLWESVRRCVPAMCLALVMCCPLSSSAQADQVDPAYKYRVELALEQLKNDNCDSCLLNYQQAFTLSKHSALSHLRAARCAVRCKREALSDSLIHTATQIDWSLCLGLMGNAREYPELNEDVAFKEQVRRLARQQGEAMGINFELMETLEGIHVLDQKYRKGADSMRSLFSKESAEFQLFLKQWRLQDSSNLAQVEAIIAQYGFPGKSLVGSRGARSAWLVLQHAPLEKQEQYFPLFTKAADDGELAKADWAYLLDRINMYKGLPQVYGSQITRDPETGNWRMHPIENEHLVNERRASVGLGPLEDYARRMGVEWRLPASKD